MYVNLVPYHPAVDLKVLVDNTPTPPTSMQKLGLCSMKSLELIARVFPRFSSVPGSTDRFKAISIPPANKESHT